MEISYQKNITQSFLIVKENSCIDFEVEMITQNQIYRFLNLDVVRRDSKIEYWYDITGLQSIQDYLGNQKMEYKLFRMLYFSIYKILLEMQRYLLEQGKVCLDLDKIYIDAQSDKIYVCYFPFPMEHQVDIFLKFMENILAVLDHRDSYAVEKIYHIYEMARQGSYDMQKIQEDLLQDHSNFGVQNTKINQNLQDEEQRKPTKENRIIERPVVYENKQNEIKPAQTEELKEKKSFFLGTMFQGLCEKIEQNIELPKNREKEEKKNKKQIEKRNAKQLKYKKKANEEEEKVFSFDPNEEAKVSNPTVLLSASNEIVGELKYLGREDEADYAITKQPFFIGSKKIAVHAYLSSRAVSKIHAKIYKKDQFFYIEDLNSKNGTWIEDSMIACNTPYVLKKNMKLKFADVLYEFI